MLSDARHALRLMRATPFMTAVLVLTTALGIGATTALFSVVYGVLFRPLPYYEPARLMQIRAAHATGVIPSVSYDDFRDFDREERSFQHFATSVYWTFNLTRRAVPMRLLGARATGDLRGDCRRGRHGHAARVVRARAQSRHGRPGQRAARME